MLRAYGAEVVITPTAVDPHSPESYYSVSDRLAEEIPGGFKPDQYSNPANPGGALRDDRPRALGADGRRATSTRSSSPSAPAGRSRASAATSRSASSRGADRRGRSRGLGLHRRRGASRGPVPRRGHRQGVLAGHARRVGRGRVGARVRPRLVPHRAPARARGGAPRRRLDRLDRVGGNPGREAARARLARPDDVPGLGPLVPVEVLRRQLDDPVRLPRADDAAARDRGGAPLPARGPRGSRISSRSARTRRSARRSTRCSATASRSSRSCARRAGRLARGRRRLAPGARAARARVPERRRAERGRRRRDAAAASGRRRRRVGGPGLRGAVGRRAGRSWS